MPTEPFQTLISEASFSSLTLFPKPRLSLPPYFLKDFGAEKIRYAILYRESCNIKDQTWHQWKTKCREKQKGRLGDAHQLITAANIMQIYLGTEMEKASLSAEIMLEN